MPNMKPWDPETVEYKENTLTIFCGFDLLKHIVLPVASKSTF